MNKIKELINELNNASLKYYNGQESPLSDKEFDIKLEQLKLLEKETGIIYSNSPTQNVGAPVLNKISKIEIKEQPMLSLDKVHSAEEIANFENGYDIMASIKCDGLSVRIIYQNGELISANTRGNGYIGSDITNHIKNFLNVPLKINKEGIYIIDGEAIILKKDFDIININNEFKNSRNTASGSLALLDMSIVKERRLSFYAWDIIKGGKYKEYHYNLEEAKDLGFTIVPGFILDATQRDRIEEINDINKSLLEIAKEEGIPCDGVVWRINDIEAGKKMGQTAHHFLNAKAWKPANEEYETELLDIDWGMSRNGQLTPVAVFKEIDMDGSVVSRASLHNYSVLKETLGLYPDKNQPIWVVKSNEIIPQISRAIKNDIPHDHILNSGVCNICPICGHPTEIRVSESGVETVYCGNPSCEGKLQNRIDHYLGKKGLDVKGISKETIGKLIDWGWVSELKDIYNLEQYRRDWESRPGFGKTSVDKILSAINTEGRFVQLDAFISAIGIPLVGRTVAKEIVKYYDTWDDFRNAVGGDWTQFDGFGPEISRAINNFNYNEADKIAEILDFKIPEVQSSGAPAAAIKDKIFCVTGKLISGQFKNRDELKADIEKYGGKVTSSVSSKTNYLISNEASSSAKSVKAKELGVKVITEEEYLKMRT